VTANKSPRAREILPRQARAFTSLVGSGFGLEGATGGSASEWLFHLPNLLSVDRGTGKHTPRDRDQAGWMAPAQTRIVTVCRQRR
jgi:hypothetical protein